MNSHSHRKLIRNKSITFYRTHPVDSTVYTISPLDELWSKNALRVHPCPDCDLFGMERLCPYCWLLRTVNPVILLVNVPIEVKVCFVGEVDLSGVELLLIN